MSRPDELPEWATDSTFTAPGEDWDGEPTKVEPSAGKKATGQAPESAFPSPEYNWILDHHSKWITHLNAAVFHEDFIGAEDPSLWATATGTALDDTAAGACGAYLVESGQTLETPDLGVLTADFAFVARVRTAGLDANVGGPQAIGLSGQVEIAFDFANSKWVPMIDTVAESALSTVAPSSSYLIFMIRRVADNLTMYVDGTKIYDGTYSTSIVAPVVFTPGGGTVTTDIYIDFASLSVARE